MVKTTKRTGARALLLAVASAAVMARGADAAISGCVAAATAKSITGMVETSGATSETDCRDCILAAGYYVKVAATDADCASLVIEEAPANWFAPGGGRVGDQTGTAEVISSTPAQLSALSASDAATLVANSGTALTTLGVCPENSSTQTNTGQDALADCKTDAGYYLRTAAASATGVVIKQAPANWYSAGGIDVTDTAKDTTVDPADLVATTHSSSANDIQRCPFSGTSQAGSDAVTKCTPDCSSLTVAVSNTDGTTALGAGVGIQNIVGATTGKLTDCETAPGFYLRVQATSADDETSLKIQKAPANYYAPGLQNVVSGNVHNTGPDGTMAEDSSNANKLVTACPYAGTSAAGSSLRSDCTPDCSTTNADSNAVAFGGDCFCNVGAYNSNGKPTTGTGGVADSDGCTKCSTTFAAAGAGVTTSGYGNAAATACKTAPGYIINYPATQNVENKLITVVKAPAGHYAAGFSTILVNTDGDSTDDDTNGPETPSVCPANSNSVAGAAFCTCNDGYIPALGGTGCQAYAAAAAAAASPTAASPTAESAGASTPIAVALAAAAAVPLLL